jgi:glycosyltransferase involved in cell wall biosynthesis
VYPPVDTEFYSPPPSFAPASEGKPAVPAQLQPKFLVVSALVPYKRVDLAMMAARQAGVGLMVVGNGPERANLERLTGDGIELLGWLEDEQIRELYRSTIATILPGEEDFGIVPVEAQACGRPVVALGRGGALDTVIDGETGVLFGDTTVDSLAAGLQRAASMTWDAPRIRRHAEGFSRSRFVHEIQQIVEDTLSAPAGARW